jgi:hypothetical protein
MFVLHMDDGLDGRNAAGAPKIGGILLGLSSPPGGSPTGDPESGPRGPGPRPKGPRLQPELRFEPGFKSQLR